MQFAGGALVVIVGLVLLWLVTSGRLNAAVATWKAAYTGQPQSASATPSTVPGSNSILGGALSGAGNAAIANLFGQ